MNAILLCAGLGQRFQPLSFHTPKPLTPIGGLPLAERAITMLRGTGVKRITVVTGHMPEKFRYLVKKYQVELVHNPLYAESNNNTSIAAVKDRLEDSLIIDGDLLFERSFLPYLQPGKSQFISQETQYGEEWELFSDGSGRVTEVLKWSPKGYAMVGVSYWQGEGARILAEELSASKPDEYWEEAAIRTLRRTPVYLTKIPGQFLKEMDTLVDALNQDMLNHAQIAELLSLKFTPVQLKGLTNHTWLIRDHNKVFRSLRIPGKGTEHFIAREDEPVIIKLIQDFNITPETHFYAKGLKTSYYLSRHRVTSHKDFNAKYFRKLAEILDMLHAIKHEKDSPLRPMYVRDEIEKYESQARSRMDRAMGQSSDLAGAALQLIGASPAEHRAWILEQAARFDAEEQVLCHRDLLLENIMVLNKQGHGMQLIDFEYAGFCNPLWDAASFILEANITGKTRDLFIKACRLDAPADKLRLTEMEIVVDYIWGLWGVVNGYLEYAEVRLTRSVERFVKLKAGKL